MMIIFSHYFRTRRLRTLYVFGREDVCVDKCCDSFKELFPETDAKVVLLFDTIHHHVIGKNVSLLHPYILG